MHTKHLSSIAALALLVSAVPAQTTFYDNLATSGTPDVRYANGGSIADAVTPTTFRSRLVADDIDLGIAAAGATITSFAFSITNGNSSNPPVRPLLRFYEADPLSGLPGRQIFTTSIAFVFPNANGRSQYSVIGLGTGFIVPASGRLWAGVAFETQTTSASTTDAYGQIVVPTPTIGSSSASAFLSSTGDQFIGDAPSGSLFTLQSGAPANFAWRFIGNPVPEPASLATLALGGLALVRRRRRA